MYLVFFIIASLSLQSKLFFYLVTLSFFVFIYAKKCTNLTFRMSEVPQSFCFFGLIGMCKYLCCFFSPLRYVLSAGYIALMSKQTTQVLKNLSLFTVCVGCVGWRQNKCSFNQSQQSESSYNICWGKLLFVFPQVFCFPLLQDEFSLAKKKIESHRNSCNSAVLHIFSFHEFIWKKNPISIIAE